MDQITGTAPSTAGIPLVLAPDNNERAFGRRSGVQSYGPYLRLGNIRCGTLRHTDTLSAPWHQHELHQIEYAIEGVVEIQTPTERYVLAPQQAAWVPAGLAHRAVLHRATAMSIFLDPALVSSGDGEARVIVLPPLLHEMALYAVRWPIYRSTNEPFADIFFQSLAHLVGEVLQANYTRPPVRVADPMVQAAMAYTQRHLQTVSLGDVCRVTSISERTLRRMFMSSTGMTWRQYLTQSRLESAQAILRSTDRTVADVAHTVGFDSVSAFTRAYSRLFGEPPTAFRRD
jgi:AraC-like DNA-binding protein